MGALTLQNHELAGQQLGRGFYCTLKNSHFFYVYLSMLLGGSGRAWQGRSQAGSRADLFQRITRIVTTFPSHQGGHVLSFGPLEKLLGLRAKSPSV